MNSIGDVNGAIKIIDYLKKKNTLNVDTDFDKIIEPMTCMIRLAILSFNKSGTKISIHNNKIYFNKPTLLQGTIRWGYGDKREDINIILKPIIRAVRLYEPSKRKHVKTICEFAIKGLRLLKESYINSSITIQHVLDFYINIISNSCNDIDITQFMGNTKELNVSQNTRINLTNVFKDIWDDDQIKVIAKLLLQASSNEKTQKNYVKAVRNILNSKEEIIKETIQKVSQII